MLYLVLLYFSVHLALYFTSDISFRYITQRVSSDATRIEGDLNVDSRCDQSMLKFYKLGNCNTWQA